MHRKLCLAGLLISSLLTVLLFYALANAAPMPARPVVNHQTRQCAVIVTGDECGDVILPTGWEYLNEAAGEKCPDGYTTIDLHPDWAHFKVAHCCTEGHSGSSGDCQDVVIHQSNQQCAFVEDIQNCTVLPGGWNAWGKNCPTNFEWIDEVLCSGGQVATTTTTAPTSPPILRPTPTVLESDASGSGGMESTLEPTETYLKSKNLLPCPSVAMVSICLVGIGFWQKRGKR
jgi:hypothetical protein